MSLFGKSAVQRECPMDHHGSLDDRGFCALGSGYPLLMRCPFACPICRRPLTWDGSCFTCHGTTRAGDEWIKPGDLYLPSRGHWVAEPKLDRPAQCGWAVRDDFREETLMR